MAYGKRIVQQREPLRVPQGWSGQERAFVIQLERILTDIYKHFEKITYDDLSPELQEMITSEEES